MKKSMVIDLSPKRFWKAGVAAFGLLGLYVHFAGVHSLPIRGVQPKKPGQTKAQHQKKLLIQKINRYWQLREEANERGIDTSQVPAMLYVVGNDGNIYRILPDGKRQQVPDDEFHAIGSPTAATLQ